MNTSEIARLAVGWWRPVRPVRRMQPITVQGVGSERQALMVVWWLFGRHAKG